MGQAFPRDFGRYTLVERLAVGGMAEIYRATMSGAHDFHKVVVIKQLLPHLAADREFVAMFINEAKLTAKLTHPKIVQVHELGTLDERLYIAMEFVDGIDFLAMLKHFARRREKVPAAIAVYILSQVLDALDYAHQATGPSGAPLEIIHRDVSPGNVLISRRGDVKLTDFGIAHAAAEGSKTNTGTLKGKYSYMSPEQIMHSDLDCRSDLFACGVVLAEALIGRPLFTASSELDVLLMVRDVRLDRLERFGGDIEPTLREIVERALRRDRNDRFGSAREFREALDDWMFDQRLRTSPSEVARLVLEIRAEEKTGVGGEKSAHSFQSDSELEGVPAPGPEQDPRSSGNYALITTLDEQESAPPPAPGPEPTDPQIHGDSIPIYFDDLELPELPEVQGSADPRADQDGDFSNVPPLRLLYRLAVSRSSGLLQLHLGDIQKRAYFVRGVPQHVESNVATERLGEFLVTHGLIEDSELSMALAVMQQMGGQLGDTLIALGLIDALGAVRALTESVRDKMVDVCTWQKGKFSWFEGRESPEPAQIRIDPFELMGAGAMALAPDHVHGWAQWHADDTLVPRHNPHADIEAFGLGPRPREILSLLDGRRTLTDFEKIFPDREIWLDAIRVSFLLVQTECAKFT